MFSFTERLFSVRSVQEVLDDAAAGYFSVLPFVKENIINKDSTLSSLKSAGEDLEIISSLLAGGDVSRLQKYYNYSMCDNK